MRRIVRLLFMAAVIALTTPAAFASAAELDFSEENTEFTAGLGAVTFVTEEVEVSCAGMSGSGEFESGTTGMIELTFSLCKASGTNCTTPGQSTGTITTTTLPLHVVEIAAQPAILIQPNEEHFASFKCAFGLVSITLTGNGVVGTVSFPGYGESWSTIITDFRQSFGQQEHSFIDESATEYGLNAAINGGEPAPLGFAAQLWLTLAFSEATITE